MIDKHLIEKYFGENGSQILFVFNHFSNTLKHFFKTSKIFSSRSKSGNSFALQGVDDYPITKVKFNGSCLRQDSISFIHENIVNLYIFHKLDTWSRDLNTDFILGNCFFGDAKLAKNADSYKCGYSDCGVGFDVHSKFS